MKGGLKTQLVVIGSDRWTIKRIKDCLYAVNEMDVKYLKHRQMFHVNHKELLASEVVIYSMECERDLYWRYLQALFRKGSSSTKIIVISKNDHLEFIGNIIASGANGYVSTYELKENLIEVIQHARNYQFAIPCKYLPYFVGEVRRLSEKNPFQIRLKYKRMEKILTRTEIKVYELLINGKSTTEMANVLFYSVGTIKRYIYQVQGKLGVENRIQAIRVGYINGWFY